MKGKTHSVEAKQKNRLWHLGKKWPKETIEKRRLSSKKKIAVKAIHSITGGEQTFISIRSAARLLHVSLRGIFSCLAGKQKTAGGYKWVK